MRQLLKTFGIIKVYEVDGEKIRKDLDPNFTNFGQHYDFNYIPKNELWIDRENSTGEKNFFITHMLTELKLIENGMGPDKADDVACIIEEVERHKSKKYQLNVSVKDNCDKVKIKKIADIKGILIFEVDGELVRDFFYDSFTEGGHDLVYNWIPEKEIWIDNDVVEKERPFIILHEFIERSFMEKGMIYEKAHMKALVDEWESRRK